MYENMYIDAQDCGYKFINIFDVAMHAFTHLCLWI